MIIDPSRKIDSVHSFQNPPVVETVLGFQFAPIPSLKNPLLVLFWNSLRKEFPIVEEVPPIATQHEKFEEKKLWSDIGDLNFMFSQEALGTRLRLIDKDRSRMIQIQNSRFHFNWMANPGEKYPRFSAVRLEFGRFCEKFSDFLKENTKDELHPDQWEVTYINHIPKGTLWNTPQDWNHMFQELHFPQNLGKNLLPDRLFSKLSFEIGKQQGRLHIQINEGRNKKNPTANDTDVLRIDLTARGALEKLSDLDNQICFGRKTIVESFKSLTSEKAHNYWEIANA